MSDSNSEKPSASELERDATNNITGQTTPSKVEYYGVGSNSCGYCKKDGQMKSEGRSRVSYDMLATSLTCGVYQDLLDRGWRRSGHYCYKPINHHTCCPNYTIRLKASDFKLTRSQRRCIKNFNNFLVTGNPHENANFRYHKLDADNFRKPTNFDTLKISPKARDRRFVGSVERKIKLYDIGLDEAIRRTVANNRRRYDQQLDHLASLEDLLFPTNLTTTDINPKHRLEIRMHHVETQASRDYRDKEVDLIRRYQEAVHKEGPDEWTFDKYSNFLVNSPLITEPMQGRRLKSLDGGSQQYPLTRPVELPTSFGTYHCCYLLDGNLIAVGVLDVLPKGITTVYFFYDTDYSHLNLGIYSALVEISMIRLMTDAYTGHPEENKFIYYYMGFYVHECKKMHYKVSFKPAHLLCCETLEYVPVEDCLNKLKSTKYARFGPDHIQNVFESDPDISDLLAIPISVGCMDSSKLMDYASHIFRTLGEEAANCFLHNIVIKYVLSIGKELCPRIVWNINYIDTCLTRRFSPQSEVD